MLKIISTIGANWKIWAIVFAIGVLSGGAAGFKLGGMWQGWACTIEKSRIAAAAVERQKLTEATNAELQTKYDAVSKRAAASRVRTNPKCLPIASTSVTHASGGEHAGKDGISDIWLTDYAAECERYRQERIALEQFQNAVWRSNGQ